MGLFLRMSDSLRRVGGPYLDVAEAGGVGGVEAMKALSDRFLSHLSRIHPEVVSSVEVTEAISGGIMSHSGRIQSEWPAP